MLTKSKMLLKSVYATLGKDELRSLACLRTDYNTTWHVMACFARLRSGKRDVEQLVERREAK